jgi:quercetin dioxygenase-like cupin family protein
MTVQSGFREPEGSIDQVAADVLARYEAEGLATEHGFIEPGRVYPPHAHEEEKHLYTAAGSITMRIGDRAWITLRSGEELVMPLGQAHEAKVGPEGWGYVVGLRV